MLKKLLNFPILSLTTITPVAVLVSCGDPTPQKEQIQEEKQKENITIFNVYNQGHQDTHIFEMEMRRLNSNVWYLQPFLDLSNLNNSYKEKFLNEALKRFHRFSDQLEDPSFFDPLWNIDNIEIKYLEDLRTEWDEQTREVYIPSYAYMEATIAFCLPNEHYPKELVFDENGKEIEEKIGKKEWFSIRVQSKWN